MRTFIIRLSIVVIVISLQVSFLNLIFSENIVINLLPLIALAWVIIVGFEKIWNWIIALGIFADLLLFEKVGINVIFFIGIAYAVSFFSRRFLIERKTEGFIVVIVFIILSFLFLDIGKVLVLEKFSLINTYHNLKYLYFSWQMVVIQNISNILFFYLIYVILAKIEKNIAIHENRIKTIY